MKCLFRRGLMPCDIMSSNRSLVGILALIPCKHEEPQCLLVPALLLSLHTLGTIPYNPILWIDHIQQDPSRYVVYRRLFAFLRRWTVTIRTPEMLFLRVRINMTTAHHC